MTAFSPTESGRNASRFVGSSLYTFVSHSSKDSAIAERVVETLESNGIPCWIAPRDIKPGKWSESIMDGIEKCTHFVLLYSFQSSTSKHTQRETHNAVEQDKVMVPVRIDDAPINNFFKYYVATDHWLDFRNGGLNENPDRLLKFIMETSLSGMPQSLPPAKTKGMNFDPSQEMVWDEALLDKVEGRPVKAANAPRREPTPYLSRREQAKQKRKWGLPLSLFGGSAAVVAGFYYLFVVAGTSADGGKAAATDPRHAPPPVAATKEIPEESLPSVMAENPVEEQPDLLAEAENAANLDDPNSGLAGADENALAEGTQDLQVASEDAGAEELMATAEEEEGLSKPADDPLRLSDSVLKGSCNLAGASQTMTVVLPHTSLEQAKVILVDGSGTSRTIEGVAHFFPNGVSIQAEAPQIDLEIEWIDGKDLEGQLKGDLGRVDHLPLRQIMRFLK